MKIGDKVVTSEACPRVFGKMSGVVVSPGISRGGRYVRVKVKDREKTWAATFWRKASVSGVQTLPGSMSDQEEAE